MLHVIECKRGHGLRVRAFFAAVNVGAPIDSEANSTADAAADWLNSDLKIKISPKLYVLQKYKSWLRKLLSYVKGGIQAKGIWKQDPEANIWAQEEWECGAEEAPQRTS